MRYKKFTYMGVASIALILSSPLLLPTKIKNYIDDTAFTISAGRLSVFEDTPQKRVRNIRDKIDHIRQQYNAKYQSDFELSSIALEPSLMESHTVYQQALDSINFDIKEEQLSRDYSPLNKSKKL